MLQNTELIFNMHTHTHTLPLAASFFFFCRVLTVNFVALFSLQVFKACTADGNSTQKALLQARVSINMLYVCMHATKYVQHFAWKICLPFCSLLTTISRSLSLWSQLNNLL